MEIINIYRIRIWHLPKPYLFMEIVSFYGNRIWHFTEIVSFYRNRIFLSFVNHGQNKGQKVISKDEIAAIVRAFPAIPALAIG